MEAVRSGVQGHSRLSRQVKVSLRYMTLLKELSHGEEDASKKYDKAKLTVLQMAVMVAEKEKLLCCDRTLGSVQAPIPPCRLQPDGL